jgi:hypothetical protein
MGAAGRKGPVLYSRQVGQIGNQHHGRIADRQKHALRFGVDDAPAGSSGEVNGPSPFSFQSENLELRFVGIVSDAGGDRGA